MTSSSTPHSDPAAHAPPFAAALACLECRRKHLRCDGGHPSCRRCSATRLSCRYLPSRRGRKRRHEHTAYGTVASEAAFPSSIGPSPTWTLGVLSASPLARDPDLLEVLHLGGDNTYSPPPRPPQAGVATEQSSTGDVWSTDDWAEQANLEQIDSHYNYENNHEDLSRQNEALVNLYYTHFHRCHPILVPHHLYQQRRYPQYLQRTVQFVGSHYSTSSTDSSNELQTDVAQELHLATSDMTATTPPSGPEAPLCLPIERRTASMVQALLLFSVAAHARHELLDSETAFGRAVQLALELGMNRQIFATGPSSLPSLSFVEQESMRRTWWELYVIDSYLTALHHKASLRTAAVVADVMLPCEEDGYGSTTETMPPLSLADFDRRMFAEKELPFSSFCYRIEAARLLARAVTVTRSSRPPNIDWDAEVEATDHALASWTYHLRADKHDIFNKRGILDEMLFQAHVLAAYATMVLHCPYSGLVNTLPTAAEISCSGGGRSIIARGRSTQHTHAVKTVDAACYITHLAALKSCPGHCTRDSHHTPFFVCALLLAATVQLADCVTHPAHRFKHSERIRLAVGVLKSLSQHWPLSLNALRLVRRVAGEILQQGREQVLLKEPLVQRHAIDATSVAEGLFLDGAEPWVLPLVLEMENDQGLSLNSAQ